MKKTLRLIGIVIALVLLYILFSIFLLNILYEKEFNKFNYESAKEKTIDYLNDNEEVLKKIVDELYESKTLVREPYDGIRYASYNYSNAFAFEEKFEYIDFSLDGQGMLGGQSYGLIYSNDINEELVIYDESEVRKDGNNIFIRQRIKGNWYFFYDDYDGKVDIDKVKK